MSNETSIPVTMKMVEDIVGDLNEPKQHIYFADLLICSIAGWALFILAIIAVSWPISLAALVIGSFFLFRGLAFIHELVHQQRMRWFRFFWHALISVPLFG